MQGSRERWGVARLAWAAVLTGSLASLIGCSGEAEVTTLPAGGSSNLLDPELSSDSPASSGPASDGAGAAASTNSEAPPTPNRLSGREPSAAAQGATAPAGGDAGDEVPDSEHCAAVSDWDPEWVQFEEEVLLLVNENRARVADCGEEGEFEAASPVVMDPILRCSARLQSLDMFERNFFDHTNPDGKDPFERMDAAGFRGSAAGENIAVGQTSPQQVMQSWMDSDGHCSNVMRANYSMLGVGYHPGAGGRGLGSNYWTQNFGAPARRCLGCR